MKTILKSFSFLPLTLLTACGAQMSASPAAMAPGAMAAPAPAPPPLDHSLYAKDQSGSLSEHDLQKVLESPIDLEL
ncbi:MAG TPA: hypothetical protein VF316_06865, partial [Polyangiaceae bacterium]